MFFFNYKIIFYILLFQTVQKYNSEIVVLKTPIENKLKITTWGHVKTKRPVVKTNPVCMWDMWDSHQVTVCRLLMAATNDGSNDAWYADSCLLGSRVYGNNFLQIQHYPEAQTVTKQQGAKPDHAGDVSGVQPVHLSVCWNMILKLICLRILRNIHFMRFIMSKNSCYAFY